MEYFKQISLTNWNIIIEKYSDLISNAGTLHAKKLTREDNQYLYNLVADDVEKFTGKSCRIRESIAFFQIGNHTRGIHLDGDDQHNDFIWALNIPIINCDMAKMVWYKGDYEIKSVPNARGLTSRHVFWNSPAEEITSCFVAIPTIVRVNVPHTVTNYSENPRCLISIRFTPELL
jgi:hypothetical protein